MEYLYNRRLVREEHEQFRTTVRRFFVQFVEPNIDRWIEHGSIDPELWVQAGKLGILCTDIPEAYGGAGGDFLHRVVLVQEMGYSPAGACISSAIVGDFLAADILHHASEAQKRDILPKMATGALRVCFGMTEPDSGSDPASMRTTAVRDGDHYVINGAKTYISNSLSAGLILVACKTAPELGNRGITLFFVEPDRPGFRRGRKLKKMGMNACETGELFFDDVRVPASSMYGPENGGFKMMMASLNQDRLIWPLLGHASAQRAFDETVAFVQNRRAFGQRVMDFQNTQFRLAEMKTDLAVGKSFLDDCLRAWTETGHLDPDLCAMAKLWLPEMEGRVIDRCVQLHGGAGYMDEYPVSRLYTAARLHRIFAGTDEIMRMVVGRTIR
jgi:alkylation response protein AidB-like acyl-CoA dehydrogenase